LNGFLGKIGKRAKFTAGAGYGMTEGTTSVPSQFAQGRNLLGTA